MDECVLFISCVHIMPMAQFYIFWIHICENIFLVNIHSERYLSAHSTIWIYNKLLRPQINEYEPMRINWAV